MDLLLTESAAKCVDRIMKEDNELEQQLLRISVEGGGCSGMQYKFNLEPAPSPDDIVHEFQYADVNIRVIVDPISAQYLLGAEIDFKDDKLNGSRFVVRNPNAQSTCGCGNSFAG